MKCWFILAALISVSMGEECEQERNCKRPHCSCYAEELNDGNIPQFVMLTFDDAVNTANEAFYKELLMNQNLRKNKKNGCNIGATFFVTHEYNNYPLLHDLHNHGSEIALHSITHKSELNYWKTLSAKEWEDEMIGLKKIITKFAKIPEDNIVGLRAPFLQVGGDNMFEMIKKNNLYDCSMAHTRVSDVPPIFPYTLDFGYVSNPCLIEPCPEKTYNGTWVVPMNMLFQKQEFEGIVIDFPCSMADACAPPPNTADEMFEFLKRNFQIFYESNKAPFPLFLHEAWLKAGDRNKGYIKFVDWLLEKNDVFIVPIKEVIEYMKNPQPVGTYNQHFCTKVVPPKKCSARNCPLETPLGPRILPSCVVCPKKYPWLGNPGGV